MPPTLHRPEPILSHTTAAVDGRTPARAVAARLRAGEQLIVRDRYGTGADVLAELYRLLKPPAPSAPYGQRQAFARAFREASLRLLAPIAEHRVALSGAAQIGFLAELYPDVPAYFALPFVEIQDLHSAWRLYEDGVHLAVLGHRVHPLYGTYAPTRTSHLELFGTWLSQYQGPRTRAIDVGAGCGVLALMLCRAGFARVLATDINPNAIESVARERRRLSAAPLELLHGDLLAGDPEPSDLIVFNPPWTRGEAEGPLERALVYDEGLFERFFDQAIARLTPPGRIVMLFSNVMQLVQPDLPHPILAELERGRLRLVQKTRRRVKPPPGRGGRRRRTRERVEVWELAP